MPAARQTPSATAVAVAAGGAMGALLRHGLTVLLPEDPWAWGVLVANVIGAGLLAAVVRSDLREPYATGLRTGVLGAFTTFSALAVATADGLGDRPVVALAYLVVTFVAGWGAAIAATPKTSA